MATAALLLLGLSTFASLTGKRREDAAPSVRKHLPPLVTTVVYPAGAILFGEPRIYGDDATGYGPIFEEEPVDVVYSEDSPDGRVSMNCRARANPPATYRYQQPKLDFQLKCWQQEWFYPQY